AVAGGPDALDELLVFQLFRQWLVTETSAASEEEQRTVRRQPGRELPPGRVQRRAGVAGLGPAAGRAPGEVKVVVTDGVAALLRGDHEQVFLRRDQRLDLLAGRVDRRAQVLGRLPHAVDQPRPPDVVAAEAAGPAGAEVHRAAVRGQGRVPLVGRA